MAETINRKLVNILTHKRVISPFYYGKTQRDMNNVSSVIATRTCILLELTLRVCTQELLTFKLRKNISSVRKLIQLDVFSLFMRHE